MNHQQRPAEHDDILSMLLANPAPDVELDDARILRIEQKAQSLAGHKKRRMKRRAAIIGGSAIAVLAMGAVTPAVASKLNFNAVVNLFDETAGPGASETPVATYIDPSADDYLAWAEQGIDITRPVPPGVDPRVIAKEVADSWTRTAENTEGGVLIEPGVAQNGWDAKVSCLWIVEWFNNYESQDQVALEVSTNAILNSPDLLERDENNPEWDVYAADLGARIAAHEESAVTEWKNFMSCGLTGYGVAD